MKSYILEIACKGKKGETHPKTTERKRAETQRGEKKTTATYLLIRENEEKHYILVHTKQGCFPHLNTDFVLSPFTPTDTDQST